MKSRYLRSLLFAIHLSLFTYRSSLLSALVFYPPLNNQTITFDQINFMEGAIGLFILILIGILLIPIFITSSTNSKINELKSDVSQIKNYLKQLQLEHKKTEEQSFTSEKPAASVVHEPEPLKRPIIYEAGPVFEVIQQTPMQQTEEEETEDIIEEMAVPEIIPVVIAAQEQHEEIPMYESVQLEAPVEKIKPAEQVYFKNLSSTGSKTNFEQFIGEKLISIVGIAILVLGIFFTVKWAIDKELINDAGKVLIGLLSGTILIATAHRLSKNYRAFSSILAGGGIAVLYFSIYEAYQSYHLFSQIAAFAIMILITILSLILSVFYDKKELAIIALVGGFCTPFFVSNSSGNYQVLFTYMLILNIGMFCLAYFKKWNLINIISYGFTILIFGAWLANSYDITKGHNAGGFLFATFFYVVFFGMNIIYTLRYKTKFAALEIGLLLSNSGMYLGVGLFFLSSIHEAAYQGVFTISLSIFNFIFAYLFYKKNTVDKNLIYLLIGLVLTYLSLTGPIQLEGNYITLFWTCEMIILYWLGLKSGISIIKNSSVVILLLTLISLSMDWQNNYLSVTVNKYPFFFNKAFITGAIVIASLFLKRKLIKSDTDEHLLWRILPTTFYRYATEIILAILIYMVGFLELQYQTDHTWRIPEFSAVILWLYQYIFMAGLLLYSFKKKPLSLQRVVVIVSLFLTLLYMAANVCIAQLRNLHLTQSSVGLLYVWHYLIPLFALFNIALITNFVNKNYSVKSSTFKYTAWLLTTAFVYIVSCEVIHIWVVCLHEPGFSLWDSKAKAIKIALPILWSVCSLALMLIGMRRKIKTLRIISLSLFTLTILKLFIYDISNVSQGGKIAAFIILGVILLLVSFMYQKIKGLFIEEENNHTQNNSQS